MHLSKSGVVASHFQPINFNKSCANFCMALAKRLISGVDIWLNTPTRPLEASGTSGQKAEMNGVLNFSVLDGWWLEGYVKGAGWAITEKKTYQNDEYQDQLDAVTIYSMVARCTSRPRSLLKFTIRKGLNGAVPSSLADTGVFK